jgi:hypothetical protein
MFSAQNKRKHFSETKLNFSLTGKCFSLTGKYFPFTNFSNGKQTHESLENDFSETSLRNKYILKVNFVG